MHQWKLVRISRQDSCPLEFLSAKSFLQCMNLDLQVLLANPLSFHGAHPISECDEVDGILLIMKEIEKKEQKYITPFRPGHMTSRIQPIQHKMIIGVINLWHSHNRMIQKDTFRNPSPLPRLSTIEHICKKATKVAQKP